MTTNQPLASENLAAAFEMFNQMSSSLGESYRGLENRVFELSEELAQVRSERTKELAEKEKLANRLSALLSVLPGGVVTVDKYGVVRDLNPEAVELLGVSKSLIGKNWPQILAELAMERDTVGHDYKFHNGKRVSVIDRILDAQGHQVILLTDVTELYTLQEWVNREKRLSALGEMSARLAHQLRTPLSSALLYTSHLSSEGQRGSNFDRITRKVIDRLHHIESLIDGMLMFVRGDTRNSSRFSAQVLMAELLTTVLPQAEARNGIVNMKLPGNDLWIKGNREALLSGLVNIIENSIQLTEQPIVEIELIETTDCYEFVVKDNGPGIPDAVIDKIFDPFFTTRTNGTGLGLAIAAVIAKEHGGDVTASNPAGGGALFRFSIAAVNVETASHKRVSGNTSESGTQIEEQKVAQHG